MKTTLILLLLKATEKIRIAVQTPVQANYAGQSVLPRYKPFIKN